MKKCIAIIGGGVAGCTAALLAWNMGLFPVIIERRSYLGFEINGRYQIFTEKKAWEIYHEQSILQLSGEEIDEEICFYQGETKASFMKQIYGKRIPCLLFTHVIGVVCDDQKQVAGLLLANSYGSWYMRADSVLDCTGDGVVKNAVYGFSLDGKIKKVSYVLELEGEGLKNGSFQIQETSAWNGILTLHPSRRGTDTKLAVFEAEISVEENVHPANIRSRLEHELKAKAVSVIAAVREHFADRRIHVINMAAEVSVPPMKGNNFQEFSGIYENQNPLKFPFTPSELLMMEKEMKRMLQVISKEEKKDEEGVWAFLNGFRFRASEVLSAQKGEKMEIEDAVLFPVCLEKKAVKPYDGNVAVIGLGTAGMSALFGIEAENATSSHTVGVESQYILGGTRTAGHVANYYHGRIGAFTKRLNEDYDIFDRNILKTPLEYREKFGFSFVHLALMFHYEAVKSKRDLLLATVAFDAVKEENKVTGVLVVNENGVFSINADVTLDMTGNGDVAALAGAEFHFGADEDGSCQTYSQWGLEERVLQDFHQRSTVGDYDMMDATEYKDMLRASIRAQMKNSAYYSSNPVSYREGRRITGRDYLDIKRAICNYSIEKPVAVAVSTIDNHGKAGTDISRMGFCAVVRDYKIALPLGCFQPKGFQGILVGGKAISVDKDTQAVVRMNADIQNAGYALGYIAARMAECGGRDVEYETIREFLEREDLIPEEYTERKFPEAKEAVSRLKVEEPHSLLDVLLQKKEDVVPVLREEWKKEVSQSRKIALAKALAWFGDGTGKDVIVKRLRWLKEHENTTYMSDIAERSDTVKHGIREELNDYWDMNQLIEVAGRIRDREITELLCEIIQDSQSGGPPHYSRFPYFRVRRDLTCIPYYDRIFNLAHVFFESPDPAAGEALAGLLKKEYIGGGYYALSVADEPLPLASYLELITAIAAYRCGRKEGRKIMECYVQDVRSVYAKLAKRYLTGGKENEN